MTLRTPRNKPHPDENDIFSGWQRTNISRVDLKPSAQPQRIAGLDPQCRLVCYPDIQ